MCRVYHLSRIICIICHIVGSIICHSVRCIICHSVECIICQMCHRSQCQVYHLSQHQMYHISQHQMYHLSQCQVYQGITFEKVRRAKNRSLKMTIWSLASDLCYEEKISARGRHYNTIHQGAPFYHCLPGRRHCNTTTRSI